MFGKTHTEEALALISKPGELNPRFGIKHREATKAIMSEKKNKYSLGVGIYDLDDNLILKFNNNVELAAIVAVIKKKIFFFIRPTPYPLVGVAKHLGISKVTVGKYLNSGLIYNKIYRFKPIQN
jgi:DNA invertase Pin-like site-specific DNA recombinase